MEVAVPWQPQADHATHGECCAILQSELFSYTFLNIDGSNVASMVDYLYS